jgi:hypothetical protein
MSACRIHLSYYSKSSNTAAHTLLVSINWQFILLFNKSLYPPQQSRRRIYWFHHVCPSVCRQILCRSITWVASRLLIKFQNILRNATQVIIRHRVNILFSVISSPITLERDLIWKIKVFYSILYQNLKINDEFMDKLTLSDYLNNLHQCKDVTVIPFIESIYDLIKKYIIITSI